MHEILTQLYMDPPFYQKLFIPIMHLHNETQQLYVATLNVEITLTKDTVAPRN